MNVIFISVDDLAAFSMLKSLYAGTVHTPNIDRIMAMGTTFENGFSQVAMCNPSRTSMLTGLSPAHTGVHGNLLLWSDAVDPGDTMMGQLMNAGFHTSMIGKVVHSNRFSADYGNQIANVIFNDRTDVTGNQIGVLDPALTGINGDEVNVGYALDLLASYDATDPFAMFVGINKPHLNWVVPQEFYDLYPIDEIVLVDNPPFDLDDLPEAAFNMIGVERWSIDPDEAGAYAMQAYLAAISFADSLIGKILDQLEATGLDDNTMIVLWTDHGYHLGDKDKWGKFTLWDNAARAPFVIAQPGSDDDGQVVGQVVELLDIMPTVYDLLGVASPDNLDGRSLVSFIEDPSLLDDGSAITTHNGSGSIRTNEWRYIRYFEGGVELYAASDTNNVYNLAGDAAYADIMAQLDAMLDIEMAEDGWVLGTGVGALVGSDEGETLVPTEELDLHGGGGDDTYLILRNPAVADFTIHEAADGGYDTLRTDLLDIVMDPNLERVISTLEGANDPDLFAHIVGNELDNVIIGGGVIYGGDGDDRIESKAGDDYIDPGRGNDTIIAGKGHDTVDYSQSATGIFMRWSKVTSTDYGVDTLQSVEHVIGTAFADTIYGTNRADIFNGNGGADLLYGEAGADTLEGGDGDDTLDGGDGIDTASYASATSGIMVSLALADMAQDTMGAGLDTLLSIENLSGSAFADTLTGDEGINTLSGGEEGDTLYGEGGSDVLEGEAGIDTLYGGAGWDKMSGGEGDDTLWGGNGGDLMKGNAGADTFHGEAGTDRIYGGNDVDTAWGGADADDIYGQAGDDVLHGDEGDDVLKGSNGRDTLDGGADNDTLDGGAQKDVLIGGAGDDILIGNWGLDTLTGGTGADSFVFETGHSGRWTGNADVISDFSQEDGDIIDLSAIDAIAGGDDDAFAFIGDADFSGTAGELRFYVEGEATFVAGDVNGDGVADFQIRLEGVHDLTAGDFVM
ncbi:sulfatase-like hydrolase/transferase [Qipengyuania sp. 1NDH17]|uniref:Sulfatase-like hydrolase/transferase n=1 Tax=Qipengyuania polymorpha TaxID=2867234 RepID=A0ABS7IW59_9SPHN|nr:sulfatase-like hydrolase/transferase [Qipengyuania polymorpha]MBX7457184.1 sulfatase-like hydrolase/transferase [Qipengyuania polymorpha]